MYNLLHVLRGRELFFFILFFICMFGIAEDAQVQQDRRHCAEPSVLEPTLGKNDLPVVKNSQEAYELFKLVYNDPRRLKDRIYWSEDLQSYIYKQKNKSLLIPISFLENLTDQIHQALRLSFADYVYYVDLGHLHLLAPIQNSGVKKDLNDFFISPQTLSLFHTGELYQFKKHGSLFGPLVKDPHWQWLYQHRNFIGFNLPSHTIQSVFASPTEPYNTVRRLEGYREVGKVYFSAQQEGCFEIKTLNSTLRFDIAIGL